MRHQISSYGDGIVRVEFCVHCGCEINTELLKDNCPGKFIDRAFEVFKNIQRDIDKSTEQD